jgi:hypothetical protein
LPIRHQDFVFVDFGSGKGRAVMLAAALPFKRVVGVEFAEALHRTAEENVEQYRKRKPGATRIELLCMDAVEYELPGEPLVLYFYEPFLETIMDSVMQRVRIAVERVPRPVYVVLYRGTSLADVVAKAGFVCHDESDSTVFVWPGGVR